MTASRLFDSLLIIILLKLVVFKAYWMILGNTESKDSRIIFILENLKFLLKEFRFVRLLKQMVGAWNTLLGTNIMTS